MRKYLVQAKSFIASNQCNSHHRPFISINSIKFINFSICIHSAYCWASILIQSASAQLLKEVGLNTRKPTPRLAENLFLSLFLQTLQTCVGSLVRAFGARCSWCFSACFLLIADSLSSLFPLENLEDGSSVIHYRALMLNFDIENIARR